MSEENDPLLAALNEEGGAGNSEEANKSNGNEDGNTSNKDSGDDGDSNNEKAKKEQVAPVDEERERALAALKSKLIEHVQWESRLKELRMGIKDQEKEFQKTENDIKALQSIGQIIGEVLKELDRDRFIVKASSGPRYLSLIHI